MTKITRTFLTIILLLFFAFQGFAASNTEFDKFMKEGEGYQNANLHDKAIGSFRKALKIRYDNPYLHFYIAASYVFSGSTEEGSKHLLEAIRLKPDFALAHTQLGLVYAMKGEHTVAIEYFEKAISLNNRIGEAYTFLGKEYLLTDQISKAENVLKIATNLNPKSELAYQYLGEALIATKQFGGAIEAYEHALTINPENPDALFGLGAAYAFRDREPSAQQADYMYRAGTLYLKRGDRKRAIKAYEFLKLMQNRELEKRLFNKLYPPE